MLAELSERRQSNAKLVVESHVSQPDPKLAGTDTADIAVVDIGVVALKVAFHLGCNSHVRIFWHPFRLQANAEATGFDVDLRVGRRTRIGEQEGQGPVPAAERGSTTGGPIGDGAGFVEAVDLHIGDASAAYVPKHYSRPGYF